LVTTAIATTRHTVHALPDLIETLVYSLHGNGALDVGGLRRFLSSNSLRLGDLYDNIFGAALSLPDVFPTHSLPYLSKFNSSITLSHQQVNAILAHQLLGTLTRPKDGWGLPTFICWYAEHNPHSMAVEGYLATLFDHFANLSTLPDVHFHLSHATKADIPFKSDNITVHMSLKTVTEESEPSNSDSRPSTAVVIPSNRHPGFGPSGTQEERLFSSSLFLCPIVLFCPSLPSNAALVTSPIAVHAAWKGHNRTARLTSLYSQSSRPTRSYILIDALELDTADRSCSNLPDLVDDNFEREVIKVYAGCVGLRTLYPDNTPHIESSAWGCGTFGGNAVVKGVILALASSCAGVEMQTALLEDRREEVELIQKVINAKLSVGQVVRIASSESAQRCKNGNDFANLLLAGWACTKYRWVMYE
jgi:poly(ADP-ribose) glycohydrolase